MALKSLARTTPTDFYNHNYNKKSKTDHNIQYSFYSKLFSKMKPIPNAENKKEEVDDLDFLLSHMDNLTIDSDKKRKDAMKTKIIDLKRDMLDIHTRDILYNNDFQKRFEATAIPKTASIVPLSPEENQTVDQVFRKGQSGLVSQFKKVTVEYKDIYRLYPETWLNDEVINFYFELLSERSTKNNNPTIHCFNTFFCSTLRDQGFDKVKRWTKRVDIFSKDLVFIPINQSYHWVLGVIDIRRKKVSVFDSLAGNHQHTLSLFLKYLQQEHLDKKKQPLDISDWTAEAPKDIPQQENMSDCGVFACTFAEKLSLDKPFDFSQQDMVNIRRRIALNIINKEI